MTQMGMDTLRLSLARMGGKNIIFVRQVFGASQFYVGLCPTETGLRPTEACIGPRKQATANTSHLNPLTCGRISFRDQTGRYLLHIVCSSLSIFFDYIFYSNCYFILSIISIVSIF